MAEPTPTTNAETPPTRSKAKKKARRKKRAKNKPASGPSVGKFSNVVFPKHSIIKALRIPQAVLENNAGRDCTDREAAKFAGLSWSGPLGVEVSIG